MAKEKKKPIKKKIVAKNPKKESLVKKVLDAITTPTVNHAYTYRVDMSLIFRKIKSLDHPQSVQRGKLAIYLDLKDIVKQFEDDKEFMALVKASTVKK